MAIDKRTKISRKEETGYTSIGRGARGLNLTVELLVSIDVTKGTRKGQRSRNSKGPGGCCPRPPIDGRREGSCAARRSARRGVGRSR